MPLPRPTFYGPRKAPVERGGCQLSLLDARYPSLLAAVIRQGNQEFKIVGAAVSIVSPFEIRTFCIAFATFDCLSHFICYTTKLRKVQKYKPYPLSPIVYRGHLYNRVWHYFLVFWFSKLEGNRKLEQLLWLSFVTLFQGSCLSHCY